MPVGKCRLAAVLMSLATLAQTRADTGIADSFESARSAQGEYAVWLEKQVMTRMRDGILLASDIYRPDAPGKFPVLLVRTPYNRQGTASVYEMFVRRGYAVVIQDVRGRYGSSGEPALFRNEADDGYDTLEWLGTQPWSNGRVGTMGGSYDGYTQIATAVRGNKNLVAMSAWVTTSDVCNNWIYTDGALFLGFALPWGAFIMDGRTVEDTAVFRDPAFAHHLPLATIDSSLGRHSSNFRELLRHPRCSDAFWRDISFENQIENIQVPMQVVTGWYDLFLKGALQDHIAITTRARSALVRKYKRLVVGPWAHTVGVRSNMPAARSPPAKRDIDFGPQAQVNGQEFVLRWYGHWLQGIDNGVDDEPPVRIFVMGENTWRDEQEWPLRRTNYTKFYIGSQGNANGAAGDGTLMRDFRLGAATDSFVYDPDAPVPTLSASPCCTVVPFGPWDQSEASARKDAPASLLKAGEVYEYTIDMWATSNTFLRGHRIRLEISSSSFPRFDRNLNTGEDPFISTRMQKARQTIYHSAEYPSHVVLPIVDRLVR